MKDKPKDQSPSCSITKHEKKDCAKCFEALGHYRLRDKIRERPCQAIQERERRVERERLR